MPDITMCLSENCPKASQCKRHKDSGTMASTWQSYSAFEPDDAGNCEYYWPVPLRKIEAIAAQCLSSVMEKLK